MAAIRWARCGHLSRAPPDWYVGSGENTMAQPGPSSRDALDQVIGLDPVQAGELVLGVDNRDDTSPSRT
jgi:hypothetical protein